MAPSLAVVNRSLRHALQGLRKTKDWYEEQTVENDDIGALQQALEQAKESNKRVLDLVDTLEQVLNEEEGTALSNELDRFDTLYRSVARSLQKEIGIIEAQRTSSVGNDSSRRESGSHSSLSVPKIQIPKFDGKPENWIAFRDMFEALIHRHATMEKIVKFQHLREAVKLPAGELNVLDQHCISENGYDEAWKALNDRYNDKRKIFCALLQKLFTCKSMANGSAEEVRRILDTFTATIKSLAAWNYPLEDEDDLANLLIVHMVTFRLDDDTRREWNKVHKCDTATWNELSEFLVAQWRSLDDIRPARKPREVESKLKGRAHVTSSDNNKKKMELVCYLCNGSHGLWSCPKFVEKNVNDRQDFVRKTGLCWRCLSKGHRVADCKSTFKCGQCSRPHHTLLHFTEVPKKTELSANVPAFKPQQMSRTLTTSEDEGECSGISNVAKAFVASSQYLMSTVALNVIDRDGKVHVLRALLDNGSDTNFITSQAANRLRLPRKTCSKAIVGISGDTTISRFKFEATIKSRYTNFTQKLELFVLDNITGVLPSFNVDKKMISIPAGTQLADPLFHEAGEIDMLLNGDVYNSASMDMTIKLDSGQYLKRTQFGWVVNGHAPAVSSHGSTYLSCFKITSKNVKVSEEDLNEKLDRFFSAEDMTTTSHPLSAEESYCEAFFNETTTRGDDGRYIVQMPFKDSWWKLQRNEMNASNQLRAVEARRQKDEKYDKLYREYMEGMIRDGFMSKVDRRSVSLVHYLPHHGVLKESSSSTKLRPVFNASSNTGEVSLNDVLCAGPTVQPEAFDILLRFREKKFVLTADITKMYLMIWIHPSQRKYLRLLWRANMEEPIEAYEMNVVTFGTKPAPFLATRTLNKIAEDNEKTFPKAAKVLKNAFYVDDLTKSFDSVEEAIEVRDHLRYMLTKAGMKLCKFSSNCDEILKGLPESIVENKPMHENGISKTLGIGYDNLKDEFFYNFEIKNEKLSTKTSVLSQIASLYDPKGWMGPVVIRGKLIMKRLWLKNLKWKDHLSQDDQEEWDEFRQSLPVLNQIRIERHCLIDDHERVELHGFADASVQAYGVVLYLLSYDREGNTKSSILCAKSRVAPKKQKTLARLELLAATLLATVVKRLSSILDSKVDRIILWSDSMIALSWITIDTSRLATFVANRVAVIQEATHEMEWRHIRGVDNPADVVSRGLTSEEMLNCELWWTGPSFFKNPQHDWPESLMVVNKTQQLEVDESDPEIKVEMKRVLIVKQPDDLFTFVETRFSSLRKIFGTLAYMRRLVDNMRKQQEARLFGELTVDELEDGESWAIRIVQQTILSDDYKALKKFNALEEDEKNKGQSALFSALRNSTIIRLSPFLHEDGLLRVKGRLHNSEQLTFNQKHQIILPHCSFTHLLLKDLHQKHLHVGAQSLVAISRQKYWIVRAKSLARKVVHECVRCWKVKPKEFTQFMGNLPSARVNQAPAFSKVAVDYTGFYNVKTSLTRNTSKTKAYVCVFKCMCTGAIHLELVLDLSAKGFLEALDRFVSRRGLCSDIFSDNATNFEGANNELRRIVDEQSEAVEKDCRDFMESVELLRIKWHFTTPLAPHAGGIYESGVKSMKHHLKRIMDGDVLFNVQQFETILCKIEAILNSRPLTMMSDDPNDFEYLSPAHFLVGRPLLSAPQRDHLQAPMNRLDRYEMVQQVQQRFWKLWYHDYLHQLQTRPKGFQEMTEIHEGMVVLLKDKNLPPMKWLMGRLTKIFYDKNKVAHNVTVKTRNGEKSRNVKYLCPLPIEM